jgi:hypothetical protein
MVYGGTDISLLHIMLFMVYFVMENNAVTT